MYERMYECMYECIHEYMYEYMYEYIYEYMYEYRYGYMYKSMRHHKCIQMYIIINFRTYYTLITRPHKVDTLPYDKNGSR